MVTPKVIECIAKIFADDRVKSAIEYRDRSPNFTLGSIRTQILRRENNNQFFRMAIRIGLDYLERTPDVNAREDLIIDMTYFFDKQSNSETFKVENLVAIPELPNS